MSEEELCQEGVHIPREFPKPEGRSIHSEDDDKPKLLDPDNPLLEKFQKALKESLLRQIERLKDDIYDSELAIKEQDEKRDALGVQAYQFQQIVSKQQNTLENSMKQLETTRAAREEVENDVNQKKTVFKKEMDRLIAAERDEKKLITEVESANYLLSKMQEWESALESDLTIKKRISEKTKKDREKLAESKRYQDLLIYNLMTKVWELENELDNIDLQMQIKEKEREELAQTVALGNTNVEAMEAEYRCLLHSWNAVLTAVGNRDKVLTCLNNEADKITENIKTIQTEVNQIKKWSREEMEKNEQLTAMKNRLLPDINTYKTKVQEEDSRKKMYENELLEMQTIVDQTEKDIEEISIENSQKLHVIDILQKDIQKLDSKKAHLEEEVVRVLGEQLTNEKIDKNLEKKLQSVKEELRIFEIKFLEAENKNAVTLLERDTQMNANKENGNLIVELQAEVKSLEKEIDNSMDNLKKTQFESQRRQRELDIAQSRLMELLEKNGGVKESPLENKVKDLEWSIEALRKKNKDLQRFWLREQKNLLDLSAKRQEQIHNSNLLKKQTLLLKQKTLKVNDEIDQVKKQEGKILRDIHNLQTRLITLEDSLFKKNTFKANMATENGSVHIDYVNKLKDAEMECLNLQEEIAQIEEDKLNLSNELIELNRNVLEWEKKYKVIKETKGELMSEYQEGGEVANMRSEVHRMRVRFGQLKKAQDKLIEDLNHCVTRRESIVSVNEAREKNQKGGMEKTRIIFQKKLDDMRNKLQKLQEDVETRHKTIEHFENEKKEKEERIDEYNQEIAELEKEINELKEKTEDAVTQRQVIFELLLCNQKRLKLFDKLVDGRFPIVTYKTCDVLTTEYNRQKELNNKFRNILENLLLDFPNHYHVFNRILNTLKVPLLSCVC